MTKYRVLDCNCFSECGLMEIQKKYWWWPFWIWAGYATSFGQAFEIIMKAERK